MEITLDGRAAIVTGGSKGIGFAIATRFAASGADVAIIARGREALDQAVKTIGTTAKGRIIGIQGDVAISADLERAYGEAMRAFGKIDIIVNNAGIIPRAPALSRRSRTRSGARISIRNCSPPSG
jgi:3-oxoacyl-[acyl-carrier protein] reductase